MELNANFSMEFNVKFKVSINPKLAAKRAFRFIRSLLNVKDAREFLENSDAVQLVCRMAKLLKLLIELLIEYIHTC